MNDDLRHLLSKLLIGHIVGLVILLDIDELMVFHKLIDKIFTSFYIYCIAY
jgi:hypothetical protein